MDVRVDRCVIERARALCRETRERLMAGYEPRASGLQAVDRSRAALRESYALLATGAGGVPAGFGGGGGLILPYDVTDPDPVVPAATSSPAATDADLFGRAAAFRAATPVTERLRSAYAYLNRTLAAGESHRLPPAPPGGRPPRSSAARPPRLAA